MAKSLGETMRSTKMYKKTKNFFSQLRGMTAGMVFLSILRVIMIGTSALMMWSGLKLVLNNDNPVVVVLTGSMEPGFRRGDILAVVDTPREKLEVGDILVYQLEGEPIPIVHRLLDRFCPTNADNVPPAGKPTLDGYENFIYITKGDNNNDRDTFLYTSGRPYLQRDEIIGRIATYFPGVGYVTIFMKEHPKIRNALFLLLGTFALMGYDN